MGFQLLKYERQQAVLTIVLNRPETYNSLNDQLCYELQDAFKEAAKDDEVRVVVLTGEGKGFCSGQDIKALQDLKEATPSEAIQKKYNPLIKLMRGLPKPVICRLNGTAAGAGCSLALACDVIVASEEAILTEAFINIALVPDSGSSFFLPRLVGMAKAFELLSLGNKITAKEAQELGMVNKVVSAAELDSTVAKLAEAYAKAPTKSIGLIKDLMNKSFNSTLEEMLNAEAKYQDIAGASEDFREGVAAFLGKRKPDFKGK